MPSYGEILNLSAKLDTRALTPLLKIDILVRLGYSMDTLPPHQPTPEALKYIESMTPAQKELHELAIQMLGSSYFVERTRGFEEYLKRVKG